MANNITESLGHHNHSNSAKIPANLGSAIAQGREDFNTVLDAVKHMINKDISLGNDRSISL